VRWKLVWRKKRLLEHPEERGEIGLFDLAADPGERDNRAKEYPEVVDSLVAELIAWRRQRPEPGLLDLIPTKPADWTARADWELIDRPRRGLEDRFLLYRQGQGFAQQIWRALETGDVERVTTATHRPDGSPRLELGGVAYDRSRGMIYALARSGDRLYEIDGAGLVIELGEVTGAGPSAEISAAALARDGARLFALDARSRRLYEIDLADLTATSRPLEGGPAAGPWKVADLTVAPSGDLIGYDEASGRVLTLARNGSVTPSRFEFRLAEAGSDTDRAQQAVWLEGDDTLAVYRASGEPGLFRLDLSSGRVRRVKPPRRGRGG
jgi:hypothetical protein